MSQSEKSWSSQPVKFVDITWDQLIDLGFNSETLNAIQEKHTAELRGQSLNYF
ncbi:hypothetical protein LJB99_06360 [Deltaproteobacteria bacterium OttesenSCG-928-K17]|nr:hypothetical protein [Deltaproteobacteria bacterium OttesenSCG-928-K17]